MQLRTTIIAIFTILFFQAAVQNSNAQTAKAGPGLKKASYEYKALRYIAAIKELKQVLSKEPDNIAAQEMIASSYRNVKNYDEALYWYEQLNKQKNVKPEWILNYAEALANKEQYEKSEQLYRKYLAAVPSDKRAMLFSNANIDAFVQNRGEWRVAYTNLNTAGSEYSPVYYKNGLMFASNRMVDAPAKNVFGWDQTPFTDLYIVDNLSKIRELNPDRLQAKNTKINKKDIYKYNDDDTEQASNDSKVLGQYAVTLLYDTLGQTLAAEIKAHAAEGKVNTRYHEGAATVLPNGGLMFTRNNYYRGKSGSSKTGINKLKIYTAEGPHWDQIEDFLYNSDEYSAGHPAVSKDGNILVFASDMPGGYGGTDLYYCVRVGTGAWNKPVNLGPKINTEGNEQFPYLYKDIMFFSSTGHAGLGGLDIFEVALKDMKPQYAPRNLGAPVNSAGDDFGMIRSDDGRSGFFTSNRRGNDDIYRYSRLTYNVNLRGIAVTGRTRLPVEGATVLLKHDRSIDTLITNAKGEFLSPLTKETDYEIIGLKNTYVSNNVFATTSGITSDSTISVLLRLDRAENVQQTVINNCDSLKRVFAVKPIYYDLDKDNIRPDAYPALNELVLLMKQHPEITVITASHCDSRASDEYNRNLSLRRGESAKAYLVAQGIDKSRIRIEYYGKSRLVNRCADGVPCAEEDQQLNRRTEFDVILNGVNLSLLNCNKR